MGPTGLGQTIAVVDRSGKVISTSKTLLGVFKEAKAAYRERKAEIVAGRQVELEAAHTRRALEGLTFDEDGNSSRPSSRGSRRPKPKSTRKSKRPNKHQSRNHSEAVQGPPSPSVQSEHSVDGPASPRPDFPRRHTAHPDTQLLRRDVPVRSNSVPNSNVDMDLAYGEVPPPLPITTVTADENDLRGLMAKVTTILDEANCLQHSVSATISSLQKNPDALAAVALTLAEISNIAAKLAPGALTALKGSFPVVIALLASPQFMIAAGVGVGVVIVALGGYKIIKKIKARNAAEEPMDELQEIGGDIDRIEAWRRGIAVAEADSMATSVDGEFITPEAVALRESEVDERSRISRKWDKASKKAKSHRHEKMSSSKKEKASKERKPPSRLQLLFH
ncbi:MAG: hypothetical protein M1837_001730 [Sclerophora amabilis]|nr:MAG: hypothetical protein M1837_001730 [Sclerophora amabilis]